MSFWKVAAAVVALCFFLTSLAAGGDLTYSGVPGKWKKGAKGAKTEAAESESTPDAKKKNNDANAKPVPKKK